MNFEINLMFLIKPFFLHGQKVMTKTFIFREQKELLTYLGGAFCPSYQLYRNNFFFK